MDKLKIIRILVAAFSFMCIAIICGLETRQAHQFLFILGVLCLFGLLLKNIWLTLFLWWTCYLYISFKFEWGWGYLSNIFYGCVLYYLVKVAFKKEHINFYINIILWVLVINLLYGCVQALGYDFIYSGEEGKGLLPKGFMGNSAVTASFIVLCLPLLLTRGSLLARLGSVGLFLPLYILHSSLNFLAGIMGLLFVLWFKLSRKIWVALCVLLICFMAVFLAYKDMPGIERFDVWKLILSDAKLHPITGWGLDSFKAMNSKKNYIYVKDMSGDDKMGNIQHWDNPHNLYISLLYEFGIITLILLGGYIRQLCLWFKNAYKEPNTIALAGFILMFFVISMGHFPAFLARIMCFSIPIFALYELQVT